MILPYLMLALLHDPVAETTEYIIKYAGEGSEVFNRFDLALVRYSEVTRIIFSVEG